MDTKLNFEQLIEESHNVGDARTKKANELKKKFFNEILPKFTMAMEKLDVESVEFETKRPLTTNDYYLREPFSGYWVKVYSNGNIYEAKSIDPHPEGFEIIYEEIAVEKKELSFSGVIDICEKIPERLKKLIERAEFETKEANSITDEL